MTSKRAVFFWDHFADYHVDRCVAVHNSGIFSSALGVQVASSSDTYAWVTDTSGQKIITLFPFNNADRVNRFNLFIRMSRIICQNDIIFLCNYDRKEIFAAAIIALVLGRTPIIMFDSKFDDKPRTVWRELCKSIFLAPYRAALVSGQRSADYLRFMGFRRPVAMGYDTIDTDRVLALSDDSAPMQKAITAVGRFVQKKNFSTLIEAYRIYCATTVHPLPLRLVGDGPLRPQLEAQIDQMGLNSVEITGFLDQRGVARALAAAAVVVQPSSEEQWGLVINEAVALAKPIITSMNVGSNDSLLSCGRNGFTVHSEDAGGIARLISLVCHSGWSQDSEAISLARTRADTKQFVSGIQEILTSLDTANNKPLRSTVPSD